MSQGGPLAGLLQAQLSTCCTNGHPHAGQSRGKGPDGSPLLVGYRQPGEMRTRPMIGAVDLQKKRATRLWAYRGAGTQGGGSRAGLVFGHGLPCLRQHREIH